MLFSFPHKYYLYICLKGCLEGSSYATEAVAKETENKRSHQMKALHNSLHYKEF